MSIKGKGAFAQIEVETFNALFFADTITAASMSIVVNGEAASVPATTTYTITVAHPTVYVEDLGVAYASGGYLQQVAPAAEALGKYSVNVTTGVYTFAAADASAAVLISYLYTPASTTGRTLAVNNHIQGYGPTFELFLLQSYQGNNAIRLYACRASKMSAPLKRDGYLISDFEFQAYADSSGKVLAWYQVTV
jgi:hypothetical protein